MQVSVIKYALMFCVLTVVVAATTDTAIGVWIRSMGNRVAAHPRLKFLRSEAQAAIEARIRGFVGARASKIAPGSMKSGEYVPTGGVRKTTPLARRQKTTFELLGIAALKRVVADFGGNELGVVTDAAATDPLTGTKLHFDAMYTELGAAVATDFQSFSRTLYPNPFHLTREEFDADSARYAEKVVSAARAGVILISVPYTVDRCDPDTREETGWRHSPNLTDSVRISRIERFIHAELVRKLAIGTGESRA